MSTEIPGGYLGKLLRVDLTAGTVEQQLLPETVLRTYVGGTGLGTKVLYDEVGPRVEWSDPENHLIIASGPLAGTRAVRGAGTFSAVTKGPMTNLAVATQANGFMGAYLKFSGFDGIVIEGTAEKLVYLWIHDGNAELRDASYLAGKDTRETEELIRRELGAGAAPSQGVSVFGIGPAGENRVRFAAIVGDNGHVASKGGAGAVMGAKRLKAIAVARGQGHISGRQESSALAKELIENAKRFAGGTIHNWGTAGAIPNLARMGALPIKNYTTNVFPEFDKFSGEYLRTHFKFKRNPCWACSIHHCSTMEVTEGQYAGFQAEEPEYENVAAFGPLLGQPDPGATVVLSDAADRLGVDINEAGWVIAWVMECYEKGVFTRGDTDGLDMTWGNVDAVRTMLYRIAGRKGIGDLLAEGVKRAAEHIGGEAANWAIYTGKGSTPRGHDHRGRWEELLDTCLSNTSTIEATFGGIHPERLGMPPVSDRFSPEQISAANAGMNGWHIFEDCLGICRFCARDPNLVVQLTNAVTGWDLTVAEAMDIGLRVINQLRVFGLRHGLEPSLERPSPRYCSTPIDGPVAGVGIAEHWDWMVSHYYELMGWDRETGSPLPETLERLGLRNLVEDLRTR